MALLDKITSPADLRKLSVDQLTELAGDIRRAICEQVRRSGGHLAPNLGVVELTIAMHYVFDFGTDRLLFDVGHQCYPHKLLTGRQHLLSNLRTRKGMAGFPEPLESPYDLFRVGHAGTGISTGVGMARGDSLNNEGYDPRTKPDGRRVAVVIGDASVVNGVAMEGLNGAGVLKRQFLVVLNDNGMSISKPQGAVSQYFDRLRLSHLYGDFKKQAKEVLKRVPGGAALQDAYHRLGEATKAFVNENGGGGGWFEHFGLLTVGPIDGHSLPQLIEFLAEARDFDRPMVLHVKTVKGKGYEFAERDSSKFHSPPAFDIDGELASEGCKVELKREGRSFTAAVGDIMLDVMAKDPKVLACTAAMPDGTGVNKLLAAYPERSFDTGICESHALDMMAGLAKTGWKPFFAVYATFLQRAFDQAFQEASLQGLPVRLLLDRAGLVGGDGAVHHGFCDTALLRVLPGAAIMGAIDEPSLKGAIEFMRTYDEGLSSVRYPRDNVSPRLIERDCPAFELGKARYIGGTGVPPVGPGGTGVPPVIGRQPDASATAPDCDVAVLAFGTPAIDSLTAADSLAGEYRVAVYDARFAKPVDTALIRTLLERATPIVTVEDHSVIGGFGSAVLEAAQAMNLDSSRIVRLGLPDSWILQDGRNAQLAEAGIDAAGIARGIRQAASLAGRGSTGSSREIAVKRPSPARV